MTDTEKLSFEQALERLEQIVDEMDSGELALEKSIELFEEGMALKKLCLERLTEAEAVVEQYVEQAAGDEDDEDLEPGEEDE